MSFTGLWFDISATYSWFFGWHVNVYISGTYDYHNRHEERCGVRKKYLGSIDCESKFRAMLLTKRINKSQIDIGIKNKKLYAKRKMK